ncbi:MAG: DUF2075 domain-containing protein [Pseudonocardiaceae bacterium]|nr:DUF2075 domain-containing protein [Pseudonocardiaceae bacterium]
MTPEKGLVMAGRDTQPIQQQTDPPEADGADTLPPSPWELTRAEARRLRRRYRRQGLPLAAIGGTHAAGAAAAVVSGGAVLLPLGAGLGAAAGAYAYAHHHATRWNRVYAAVAAASSAGWQTTAALAGVDGIMPGLLWLGGAALAIPWWARHAEPDPDVAAELDDLAARPPEFPQPPRAPESAPDPRAVTWGRHLGAKGKALAGSRLFDVDEFRYGWKATVELPIGQHWHEVIAAHKAVLSVYGLPDGRVFTEAIPGASVRTARLTVLTSDPLEKITRWTGPGLDPARGTFPLMTTADGELLRFRFWWPGDGAAHALVSGVNGSGKTKVLDLVLTEAGASDRIVPLIIDGGDGASLPQWTDRVPLAAETPGDARKLLRYALKRMDARRAVIKRQGGGSIDPTPDTPLLVIVIDEAHRLLMDDEVEGTSNQDLRRMVEKLSQEGRKFAISVVLATQVPSAKQLGGSTVLRDQLKGGTIVGLRVTESTTGNMITSGAPMPEPLHHLPAEFPDGSPTKGLGYMLTARMIRARSLLLDHPAAWPLTATPLQPVGDGEPVNVPELTGEDEADPIAPASGDLQPVAAIDDGEAARRVKQALDEGAATDTAALMRATGLSMGQVRRALATHN